MSGNRTAILALGKNWELPVPEDPSRIKLSIESETTAEAAGVLYKAGVADVIAFAGGKTAGPEYPSEAGAMESSMRGNELFDESSIPAGAVKLLDKKSRTTAETLEEVEDFIEEYEVDGLILDTVGLHMPRALFQARRAGLPVKGYVRSDYAVRKLHGGQDHLLARRVLDGMVGPGYLDLRPGFRIATAYAMEGLAWGSLAAGPLGGKLGELATDKLRHQD